MLERRISNFSLITDIEAIERGSSNFSYSLCGKLKFKERNSYVVLFFSKISFATF